MESGLDRNMLTMFDLLLPTNYPHSQGSSRTSLQQNMLLPDLIIRSFLFLQQYDVSCLFLQMHEMFVSLVWSTVRHFF
jgi:hypothetical protein